MPLSEHFPHHWPWHFPDKNLHSSSVWVDYVAAQEDLPSGFQPPFSACWTVRLYVLWPSHIECLFIYPTYNASRCLQGFIQFHSVTFPPWNWIHLLWHRAKAPFGNSSLTSQGEGVDHGATLWSHSTVSTSTRQHSSLCPAITRLPWVPHCIPQGPTHIYFYPQFLACCIVDDQESLLTQGLKAQNWFEYSVISLEVLDFRVGCVIANESTTVLKVDFP